MRFHLKCKFDEKMFSFVTEKPKTIMTSKKGYFGVAEILEDLPRKPVEENDKQLPLIQGKVSGPLILGSGDVLCDLCDTILKESYLNQHKSSGACKRNVEKKTYNLEPRDDYVFLNGGK